MTIEYVPQVVDEIIEVVRLILQERFQQRTVEQIVHVPVPQGRGRNGGSGSVVILAQAGFHSLQPTELS